MRSAKIAALVVFVLTLDPCGRSDAALMLLVSDDGIRTTFAWTGTIAFEHFGSTSANTTSRDFISSDVNYIQSIDGPFYANLRAGVGPVVPDYVVAPSDKERRPSNGSGGSSFGLSTRALWWDQSLGPTPAQISPTRSWSMPGTVESIFGTNLDGEPIEIFVARGTGDTIHIGRGVIPEPSSVILVGLAGACMILRRSNTRKNQN